MTWVTAVMSGKPFGVDEPQTTGAPKAKPAAEPDGMTFGDIIDVFNPLQHIPGVAEFYRKVTGDEISDGARFAGNALYGMAVGGPVGMTAMTAYSIAGEAVETIGENKVADNSPVPQAEPLTDDEGGPLDLTRMTRPIEGGQFLGEEVASVGVAPKGKPIHLAALLDTPANPEAKPEEISERREDTAAGKISEEGLEKLATHKSNHLPLDVLKTLQERYAARAANEPS